MLKTTIFTTAVIALLSIAPPALAGKAGETAAETEAEKHSDIYVINKSEKDFDTTLADLKQAIEKRDLKTFAVVDHAAGAASVGTLMEPTTLIIFGNPKGGTPLMMENRYVGMELPLKAMVFEEAGEVRVAMLRVKHLVKPFGLEKSAPVAGEISRLLEEIMTEATNS